jgi:dimethylsulfone monooxygenase
MNAGSSKDGRAFALRNCDAWFTSVRLPSYEQADIEKAKQVIEDAKAEGRRNGREIGAYTIGVVVCRRTRKEALDYHRYVTEENVDWGAVDKMLEGKGLLDRAPDEVDRFRKEYANGKGGLPFFGTPDDVAEGLAGVAAAGFDGIGISLVNYADEFPYFRDEVLPRLERMGLRKPAR